MTSTSKVGLAKTTSSFEGTLSSLSALKDSDEGLVQRIKSSKNIVIKINFVTSLRKLATTPVETVQGFLKFLEEVGYCGKVIVAETAQLGGTGLGFKTFGFDKLGKDYGHANGADFSVELLNLRNDPTVETSIYDSEGNLFTVPFSKTLKEADFLVSATRAKTHDTVVVTLALKNVAVGGIMGVRPQIHQGNWIHASLVELAKFRAPDLSIVDGVVGMQGNGPIAGSPIKSSWVVSGTDFLAVDSLALDLMGFDIKDVGYLYVCSREGLGNAYPENVEVLGVSAEELCGLRKKYKPHISFNRQKNWTYQ
jgi:uncharacterized protein (DUF362 family)